MTDIIDRLRAMQGMGDIQLKALMDGVGPQAAEEIDRLRAELSAAKAAAAYHASQTCEVTVALVQAESQIKAMRRQVPVCRAEDIKNASSLLPIMGLKPEDKLYALPCELPAAPNVPDVDYIVDQLSEFASHDIERGEIQFTKWTLREAVEAVFASFPGEQPAPEKSARLAYTDPEASAQRLMSAAHAVIASADSQGQIRLDESGEIAGALRSALRSVRFGSQPAHNPNALMGIPSCGGPMCSESSHHPLCKSTVRETHFE